MGKIRVLVVDDSVVIRKMVAEAVKCDPDIEVVATAPNGRIALAKLAQVSPDLITLDVEMPELDGLGTLREIRKSHPKLPVIMLSSMTYGGASVTIEALAAGAADFVTKPTSASGITAALESLGRDLIPKIKLHGRKVTLGAPAATVAPNPTRVAPSPVVRAAMHTKLSPIEIVCVGSSTGGPNALAEVFEQMRQPVPVPLVIVQHMPPLFTRLLAERFNRLPIPLRFHEAEAGMLIEPGHAYIAPGGKHLEIGREGDRITARLHEGPPENSCRPAVDVLFRSVVATYRSAILGVVMTGMGQDGLRGCEAIAEAGGRIVVQDEASSVVWGMPGFVAKAGLADEVLPLGRLGSKIAELALLHGVRPRALSKP